MSEIIYNTYSILILTFLIFIILCIVLTYIAYKIKKCIIKKRTNIVINNSTLIKELKETNKRFTFYQLEPCYILQETYNYKSAFDTAIYYRIMYKHLQDNKGLYERHLFCIEENIKKYKKYKAQIANLKQRNDYSADFYLKYKYFKKYEDELFIDLQAKPVTDFCIKIKTSYTSPKGRNHYENSKTYNLSSIRQCISSISKHEQYIDSKKVERAKMSPKLRYEILKRDGFKCKICGATAADGVQLHIDHKKPIAKGGLTERSNLQTLCNICNIGKSDSWD